MIPRSIDAIAHSHNTKLLRKDGEDAATDWGTRPSPKAKFFRENPKGIPTSSWGNRPNPRKDPMGTKIQGRHHNQLRKGEKVRSILITLKTKPTRRTSR